MAKILVLVALAVLLIGGAVMLARKNTARPLVRVEKTISPDALAH